MYQPGRQFLHTPGPSAIPDRVLNAMHRQPLDLSDPQLADIVQSCLVDLKGVFATAGDMFIYAANGHGGWEAVLSNLFAPGEAALIPETGYFSESWAAHARMLGIDAQIMPGYIRRAIDPERLEATLRDDRAGRIKAVLAGSPAMFPPCAPRSMRPGTRLCSWSMSWPRWAPRRSAWTNGASTSRSVRRRRP